MNICVYMHISVRCLCISAYICVVYVCVYLCISGCCEHVLGVLWGVLTSSIVLCSPRPTTQQNKIQLLQHNKYNTIVQQHHKTKYNVLEMEMLKNENDKKHPLSLYTKTIIGTDIWSFVICINCSTNWIIFHNTFLLAGMLSIELTYQHMISNCNSRNGTVWMRNSWYLFPPFLRRFPIVWKLSFMISVETFFNQTKLAEACC